MNCGNADLGILGVHRIKCYNDDTGYGITDCGLAIFPHEEVFTDKPVWSCTVCMTKSDERSRGSVAQKLMKKGCRP